MPRVMPKRRTEMSAQERALHADIMRRVNLDPEVRRKQREGIKRSWTPERRAKQREVMMRVRAQEGFREKHKAGLKSEYNRLVKLRVMRKLLRRRRDDPEFYKRWHAAVSAFNKSPEKRLSAEKTLAAVKRFIAQEFDNPIYVERRRKRGLKAGDTMRGFHVPPELIPLYRTIRNKIGKVEAKRVIFEEMERRA